MLIQQNKSLKDYNSFHIDVNANFFVEVSEIEDLKEMFFSTKYKLLKKLVLGEGSNLLFTRGFTGVVLKNCFKSITIDKETSEFVFLKVGAGENWHQTVLWAAENGLGGIENLAFIPGSVGAAPVQNIGAYGAELKDVFHSLVAFEIKTGKLITMELKDCEFGYRNSVFKHRLKDKYIITEVVIRLRKKPIINLSYPDLQNFFKGKLPSVKEVCDATIHIREKKLPDPNLIGNAGSFFTNPIIEKDLFEAIDAQYPEVRGFKVDEYYVKVSAAWLIEKSGWKGYTHNEIGVHKNHSLVLVNYGNGKGRDVYQLSKEIIQSVLKNFGIELIREVTVIK